jgi:arylsulfatase A-like enzyme
LGCYGYADAETPTLDALAARGILFDDAVTSVPLTLPSHATILTGLTPLDHGVHDNGRYRLADEHLTLAEALSQHGYDTAAFVSCFVLDARFGLDQGFDVYDFEVSEQGYKPQMPDYNERSAMEVTDSVIGWLDERTQSELDAPFFMWVHYFDPHMPYRSPLQRLNRFAARPYDAEIAYVDAELARLLRTISELGEEDNTLIVVAADHGEALGEHNEPTHGMLLYEPTLHVPLIVSARSIFDRAYVDRDRVVGLTDVFATVLDFLGIDDVPGADGPSLLTPARDDRAIYIETEMPLSLAGWSPLRGLRTHTHKYVLAPEPELYDLTDDPSESRNLYDSGGPVLDRLAPLLVGTLELAGPSGGSERRLSDEEEERLTALGYTGGALPETEEALPDPKAMMPTYNDALAAENLYARGMYAEAAELAKSVLDRSDMLLHAVRVLAFSYVRMGRADEAVRLLRETTERNRNVFLIRSLAQVLIIEERYKEALDVLSLYESTEPGDGRVPLLRGDIYARQGKNDQAAEEYERAIRIDENRVGIQARDRISELRDRVIDGSGSRTPPSATSP